MRSSGRQRGWPVRSLSRQSSASTVPMPVRMASLIVAELLHVRARPLAGDPAAIVVRRGDLPVQRDRRFQRDQRPAGAHEVQERLVELLGFGRELVGDLDFDAGRRAAGEALPGHQRIGICHRRHHARHARLDQRVDARRRAALVRARLQIEIQRGAARLLAGLRQRDDFGVLQPGIGVESAAHHFAIAHQHRAHQRIGTRQRPALARQVERFAHD